MIGSLMGTGLYLLGSIWVAFVAWGLSGLVLLLALASPLGIYRRLDNLTRAIGRGVGTFLSWVLLAPVFYLFFTPFGLLFRRGRRDTLARRFDPRTTTYWKRLDGKQSGPSLERPY